MFADLLYFVSVIAGQCGVNISYRLDIAGCYRLGIVVKVCPQSMTDDLQLHGFNVWTQMSLHFGIRLLHPNDAQVVKETSLAFKRSFGPLSYLISAAQIAARQPPKLFIESESTSVDEASFVLIGNGRLYGGPFPFFKHAVIDDGLFDVVLFKRLGYLEIIKYLQNVVFSSDISAPDIEYFQTEHLRVTSAQDVPLELDGELAGSCPIDFRIQKKGLRVLAPVSAT